MEATVSRFSQPDKTVTVKLSGVIQQVPSCCSYSASGDGFPCHHGVSVLSYKHGASRLHQFIESRHLTEHWRKQYSGYTFVVPSTLEVENIITRAKTLVAKGEHLHVPKALPPPKGRPVKNAGRRRKSWYEMGPNHKKQRTHSCSICRREGHSADDCPIRQLFPDLHPPSQSDTSD